MRGREFPINFQIIQGPWMQRPDPTRLSMSQFRSRVSQYIQMIVCFEETFEEILNVITTNSGYIRRPYSRKVAFTISPFREHIHECCFFLEDTLRLPLVLTALHYSFLSPLYFIDEQAQLFLKLLDELCSACILRPREVPWLYQRISQTLEIVIERVQQLPTKFGILLDQASFHDKEIKVLSLEQRNILY